ncbi:hypothetical protein XNC1_4529 [Xenorhabdus nematophila ATCC 19061]|uniref:Uncharacterized protein n=2 Tax=Xenorhabdus nematophila TaxID=628 RepID=D3VF94_XENNA|nr:hypothetical protein [Xenorhabdus nematophila]CBJ92551.1 hypothetical protein XNC1_4529 [Xenorhabdus nematophila ATCC 19061]CEK25363.1 hypothetical protein XNC2_4376 [Xenorhabdus nematophila AN6/1]
MFEYGKLSTFSYLVILLSGTVEVSYSIQLTYMGGVIYEPDPKVKRDYDPCIVYTSLYLNPEVETHYIPQVTTISYDSIKNYLFNTARPNTGLFVVILGSNDSKTNVPLGSKVTLTVYVESENKNFKYSPKPQKMPTTLDNDGYAKAVFHIDYDILVNVKDYPNRGSGNIWFDYEVSIEKEIKYGKIWTGYISTVPE